MFTKVFADADPALSGQTLDDWFDKETATFGGENAVNTVCSLVDHVARFDFGAVADQIPRVDLPDLVSFFKAILSVRSRRPDQAENLRLRFRPPEEWMDDFSIAVVERYDLLFAREPRPKAGEDVAGVGLRVVDRAVRDAAELAGAFGAIRGLDAPLFVFRVRDRITGSDGPVRAVVVAAQSGGDGAWTLVRDWELMQRLNPLADKPRSLAFADAHPAYDVAHLMVDARRYVESQIDVLELPFALSAVRAWPVSYPGKRRRMELDKPSERACLSSLLRRERPLVVDSLFRGDQSDGSLVEDVRVGQHDGLPGRRALPRSVPPARTLPFASTTRRPFAAWTADEGNAPNPPEDRGHANVRERLLHSPRRHPADNRVAPSGETAGSGPSPASRRLASRRSRRLETRVRSIALHPGNWLPVREDPAGSGHGRCGIAASGEFAVLDLANDLPYQTAPLERVANVDGAVAPQGRQRGVKPVLRAFKGAERGGGGSEKAQRVQKPLGSSQGFPTLDSV